jgi:hypothetical protein
MVVPFGSTIEQCSETHAPRAVKRACPDTESMLIKAGIVSTHPFGVTNAPTP